MVRVIGHRVRSNDPCYFLMEMELRQFLRNHVIFIPGELKSEGCLELAQETRQGTDCHAPASHLLLRGISPVIPQSP